MDTVYLVVKRIGEEYDHYEVDYGFLTSRIDAECVCSFYNKRIEWFEELTTWAYTERERIDNQLGVLEYEKPVLIPKWKCGIAMDEITTEMRNERNQLQATNKAISDRNNAKYKAWCGESNSQMAVWWKQYLDIDKLNHIEKDLLDNSKVLDFKYLGDTKFYVKALDSFNKQTILDHINQVIVDEKGN